MIKKYVYINIGVLLKKLPNLHFNCKRGNFKNDYLNEIIFTNICKILFFIFNIDDRLIEVISVVVY